MKNTKQFGSGSTALITGASSGIGYEFAKVFARNGHNLVLVARDRQRLDQLAHELRETSGVTVRVIVKDLSIATSAQEIFDELRRESVALDILVNNAGLIVYGNFYETEWAKESHMIQVNLVSLTHLTKLFVRDMVARGYGRILNIGSTGSFVPSPLNGVYSATKAYVLSFSEAIAEELEGTGVTVTALCPGATRTELQKRAHMDDVRLLQRGVMDAETVAQIGYGALMAGRRVAVPGLYNQLRILLTRFLPRTTMAKAAKAMLQRT
jgi:short-subunit dehydrogenase